MNLCFRLICADVLPLSTIFVLILASHTMLRYTDKTLVIFAAVTWPLPEGGTVF